jgi:hypothetical protein
LENKRAEQFCQAPGKEGGPYVSECKNDKVKKYKLKNKTKKIPLLHSSQAHGQHSYNKEQVSNLLNRVLHKTGPFRNEDPRFREKCAFILSVMEEWTAVQKHDWTEGCLMYKN